MEGKTLGNCRLLRKIGQGGMGAVYLAHHETLDKSVAVKILPESLASDEGFVERFLREARAAAKLDHPNVIRVLDAGSAEGAHYIVMEYVDGTDLQKIVERRKKIGVRDTLSVAKHVALALAAAHKLGIVHRDIKPANILITKNGTVKVSDFGLARHVQADGQVTRPDEMVGTPHYISPEQARAEKVDGRSDIYSLGATLYCLLTGKPPFSGPSALSIVLKHTDPNARPTPVRRLEPSVPETVEALVEKAMAKDPARRFQTAEELAEEVDRIRGAGMPKGVPSGVLLTPQKKRRLLLAGAAAGAAGLVLLVLLLAMMGPGKAERAYMEASRSQDMSVRAAMLEEMSRRFPGTEWARRADEEARSIRSALLEVEIKEIEARASDPNVPFKDLMLQLDMLRGKYPGEYAKAIDRRENKLHVARVTSRTKWLGDYVREGRFDRDDEEIAKYVDPAHVRRVGAGWAAAGIRMIMGIALHFGGRVQSYRVIGNEITCTNRKEASVPVEFTIVRPRTNETLTHKGVIQWVWVDGDWYLPPPRMQKPRD